ncbi:sigma-54-dependent Fis family transcriptional regulator [candidate division KSB1 bacterium]|nr:sigma-54-dependent Fis family transcriptional regulator [candidate division KSB1 bacterium]MBL7094967.1 sigma-54-dependent Fis family transcriptional regulator [candidate division KSB1 bacterium]
MNHLSILIIDDEEAQLISLKSFLKRRGYEIFTASNGPDGLEIVQKNTIDLVLTDFRMPEWDGLTVLGKIKELNPDIDVVVMTAYGNVESAVKIMKSGAYDYLSKPVDLDELENLILRIQEKRLLIAENKLLKEQLEKKFKFDSIITQSGEMEEVLNKAARVAASKATVLIRGESGTGKELIARAIHFASPRKDNPFVVVNVAALSENLMESELFGHEKGAFTGASQQRIGRFEQANGGTLFIDEVGDIPLSMQVKLLRAIQFGQIERLGSNKTIKVDARIIAATHRDLEQMISTNEFREDLYFRLNVVAIPIPPLKNRKVDIPAMAEYFIKKYAEENQKPIKGITREALDYLMKYEFPGNVRELENMIESAVVLARGEHLTQRDLPPQLQKVSERAILDPYNIEDGYENKIHAFEKEMITEALSQTNGNQSAAARLIGITERHLRSRLEKLGMKKGV